jgi:integrase
MIKKRRGKNGGFGVSVYNPAKREKEWIGTFPDRDSAKKAHREAEAKFATGRRHVAMTVQAWSERWLDAFHGPGTDRLEDTTRANNQLAIRPFLERFGHEKLHTIDASTARDFVAEFAWRGRPVAAMFNDAVKDGKLQISPFKGLNPKSGPGREEIDPLTTTEVQRLAEIARGMHDFYGDHFAAVITTAAWTGVRPSELGGWEWHDFDWPAGEARVRRQARKDKTVQYTKTKLNRTIVLADPALEAIRDVPRMFEYVFSTRQGRRMRPGSIGHYWRPVRDAFAQELPADHWLPRRLALDPTDRLDFYELRHMCGSIMAANGANEFEIAEHLGNSPKVCRDVYIHPFKSLVRERNREVFRRAVGEHVGSIDIGRAAQ